MRERERERSMQILRLSSINWLPEDLIERSTGGNTLLNLSSCFEYKKSWQDVAQPAVSGNARVNASIIQTLNTALCLYICFLGGPVSCSSLFVGVYICRTVLHLSVQCRLLAEASDSRSAGVNDISCMLLAACTERLPSQTEGSRSRW